MKRRDIAAALMAVLMAGSIFAGCGSSNKNVNQNVKGTQDVQLTTKAIADNEIKSTETGTKDEKENERMIHESETSIQETDTAVTDANDNSVDNGIEAYKSDDGSDMQETGGQNDTASEENAWNGENSEDSAKDVGNGHESGENNNQSGNDASASGGNVNISDDNSLLASARVNTVTYSAYASEVLRLVNIERAKVGAAPLVLDEALCNAANMRAIEMDYSGYFSHTRPNGESCFEVFSKCGVVGKTYGENIAAGYPTPEAVVDGWMNSTGHRANIINTEYTRMGLGYSAGLSMSEFGCYWAQEFAG